MELKIEEIVPSTGAGARVVAAVGKVNAITRALGVAALVCFAAWAAARLSLYRWNRFVADDFCWARVVAEAGFWDALAVFRNRWTGRYSEVFLCAAATRFGPSGAVWAPAVVFTAGLASWFWAAREWAARLRDSSPSRIQIAAWAAIAATLLVESGFDSYQDFYWLTGALTYASPLVLICLQAGIFLRALRALETGDKQSQAWWALPSLVLFALAFATAGFVETATLGQGLAWFALVVWGGLSADHSPAARIRPLSRAGLAGALAGALWMFSAPGIAVRMTEGPDPPGFLAALGLAASHAARFLGEFIVGRWPILIGAMGAGLLYPGRRSRDPGGWIALRIVLVLFALILCFWPTAYATSVYPPFRALIFPGALLTFGVVWITAACSKGRAPQSCFVYVPLLLFSMGALIRSGMIFSMNAEGRRFAAAWDDRDSAIRKAKDCGATRLSLDSIGELPGLDEFGRNAWTDTCVEAYYGIELEVQGDRSSPIQWFPYGPAQAETLRKALRNRPGGRVTRGADP